MRIIILFLILFVFVNPVVAEIYDYVDECVNYDSYKTFAQVIKGGTSISDVEKQMIIDKEIQKELIQIDTDSQSYTETQLLKFIEHIGAHILFAIANIRRPWRWDVERNNKIKDLLNN